MYISEILKSLRSESRLTQKQLGQRLGISQATIACYENGLREPHIESLIAYADLFDCSVDYLVGRSDDFGGPIGKNAAPVLTQEELALVKQYRDLDRASRQKLEGYLACLKQN